MNDSLNYVERLPSIFKDPTGWLEKFLKIFQKILTGIPDDKESRNISKIIDAIPHLFHPDEIKRFFYPDDSSDAYSESLIEEFLDWLASWVGLVLKEDWSLEKKKEIIKNIIPLYRLRGTKKGIEEFLKIYIYSKDEEYSKGEERITVRIIDRLIFLLGINSTVGINTLIRGFPLQIGPASTVGVNTLIGEIPQYLFIIEIILPASECIDSQPPKYEPINSQKKKKAIEEIIKIEKPAHTYYKFNIKFPVIQVGRHSKIGIETLIGKELNILWTDF